MTKFPRRLRRLQQLAGMLLALLVDALRYLGLCRRPPAALAAGLGRGPTGDVHPLALPRVPAVLAVEIHP